MRDVDYVSRGPGLGIPAMWWVESGIVRTRDAGSIEVCVRLNAVLGQLCPILRFLLVMLTSTPSRRMSDDACVCVCEPVRRDGVDY